VDIHEQKRLYTPKKLEKNWHPPKSAFSFPTCVWRHFSGGSWLSHEIMGFPPELVPDILTKVRRSHLRGRASHESPDVLWVAPSETLASLDKGEYDMGLDACQGVASSNKNPPDWIFQSFL